MAPQHRGVLRMRSLQNTDLVAGVAFMVIALGFGVGSLGYAQGTFFRMGPGMFPLIVSVVLFAIGGAIVLRSFATQGAPFGPVSFRALVLVLGAPIVFMLTIDRLGLLPASVLVVGMGAYASRTMTLKRAVLAVVGLVSMILVIFSWALNMYQPLFGSWFTGV